MNPLQQLHEQKQSFWLDFISRRLIQSGELKQLVENDGLRGMTSNPTIFQKAIESGDEYDSAISKLAKKGLKGDAIFEKIAVEDIQAAADLLKPVYAESEGADGFVSLEVHPNLAYKTKETAATAIRLHKLVGRKNLMVKIPGTEEGLPAIEEATAQGVNVNVTLLFSVDRYKKVFDAYLKGLERRVKKKLPIQKIQSVASFFVSRVDAAIDPLLEEAMAKNDASSELARKALHRTAIANAQLAYDHYEKVIKSPRFKKLAEKGANVQRLLWASTGVKDKRMEDVTYVNKLIGPDTVNTMPPALVDAFRDHGVVQETIHDQMDQAKDIIQSLPKVGVNLKSVTAELESAGVESFQKSYEELIWGVRAKAEALLGTKANQFSFNMGSLQPEFEKGLEKVDRENWVKRLWNKDATVWKSEESHQKNIKNSLGWLRVMDVLDRRPEIFDEVAKDVKKAKFTHVLLLGMGGSSLCPEVLRLTFGKKNGFPDFAILDSTEPASVLERASRGKPEKTLFIVASKSGTTAEPNAFLSYFYAQVKKKKGAKAGENFIAITDPGTEMVTIAKKKKFRKIILNPSDIGGRYSAMSYFGMIPAAVMGYNVSAFLENAQEMAAACHPLIPAAKNPGAALGTALGVAARAGKNKVTFYAPKEIASFGGWMEQLIAESTGKEGVGILPVESEPLLSADAYGKDRLFVRVAFKGKKEASVENKLKALEKAGHPVIRIELAGKQDLPGEFFRWEIATAIAGAFLEINPFDQPNVQDAKDLTKKLISDFKETGELPSEKPSFENEVLALYGGSGASSLEEALSSFFEQVSDNDYVALLAYLRRDKGHEKILQSIREKILEKKKVATTIGFGPRYLHSTGQLHKGGDNHGLFVAITAEDQDKAPIPGEPYGFKILKEAQARGDKEALRAQNRRLAHIHLKDAKKGLAALEKLISNGTLSSSR